jgi:Subtilase family
MPDHRLPLLAAAMLLLVALAPLAARAVSPEAAAQIQALLAGKAARTPVQRKIGSQLLYAARMARGQPVAPGLTSLRAAVQGDGAGRAKVDVRGAVDDALLKELEGLGGIPLDVQRARGALRAWLPLDAIETLAGLTAVTSVRPAGLAVTRQIDTSEGDVAHRADALRAAFGVDGTGVTVGVLSDGVDSLASLEASGDLPPVTVLPGQAGSGDEGSAILEIVHDLAPGATLLFATAFGSQASFAQNILDLRQAGAQILVDDVGYFAEAAFQDDDVAASVDGVVSDGALYFSSAGNEGNLDDGTAGAWQGDFVDSGQLIAGAEMHDFGGGVTSNAITRASPFAYTLHWSDPKPYSSNDYDLFLLNKPGTVVLAASTDVQDGNDAPFEILGALPNDSGYRLVIARNPGSQARMLYLSANRGELAHATRGQISGHPAARGAVAVAAVDVRDANGPGGTFDGTESVEPYSSDGPRQVFFEADASAITPGDFSSSGGEVRPKPDLAAADCVSTAAPGFGTFCGTSAAAPHAAALAALLWELTQGSGAVPRDLVAALRGTALDIEAPGQDVDSGAGLVTALAAGEALAGACNDGIDNDGDGKADFAGLDPGCASADDASERSATLRCDDGLDNDGDGRIDFRADGSGDLGCAGPSSRREDPQCQDGVDNDGSLGTDFDGGVSVLGVGNGDPAGPDPQCAQPWQNREAPLASCGLGFELAPLLLGLAPLLRRRRRAAGPERAP